MIKKYLLGLFLGFVGFIGFSYGVEFDRSVSLPYNFYVGTAYNSVDVNLNFSNDGGNHVLYFPLNGSNRALFWNHGKLYSYNDIYADNNLFQGFFGGCCKVYSDDGGLELPVCVNEGDFTQVNLNEFYNLSSYNFTRFYYQEGYGYYGPLVCFYNSNNKYYYCFTLSNLSGSLNIGTGYTNRFTSFAGFSPFTNSFNPDLGNGGIELGSDYSALNYYEKTYGWDESICYVGVDNVTTLYGENGVSFQQGKGLSIFDTFNAIYGNRDLDKVYVWLNVQLFNYENWFNIPGNNIGGVGHPSWLGNYNSGTNQIDLYYDNLTFPFANKPVAFYFMASNIEDQSIYYTMGSSVVSYCNIKINSGHFDDIIDDADKNNITNYTEQHNKNNGLNSNGTNIEHDGYFGSGVNIAFSGDTSIKNALKNFFDTIDNSINISEGTSTGHILPTWLLSAFMFVVLFKFLRKK